MSVPDEANRFPEMSATQRDAAVRLIRDLNPQAKFDSYEPAFAGILYRCGGLLPVAVYDVEKILDVGWKEGCKDPMDNFSYTSLAALAMGGDNTEAFCHFSYEENDDDAADIPDFEDAFLGLVEHCAFKSSSHGYAFDKKKCVEIIRDRDQVDALAAEISFVQLLSAFEGCFAPTFIEFADGYKPFIWSVWSD